MTAPTPPKYNYILSQTKLKIGFVFETQQKGKWMIASRALTKPSNFFNTADWDEASKFIHLSIPVKQKKVGRFFQKLLYKIRHIFFPGYKAKDRIVIANYYLHPNYKFYRS